MILVDTNVVVRFLAVDDMAQALRARTLVERGDLLLLLTVVLEAEWVLRTRYGFPRSAVITQLRAFAALPGVVSEDPARLARAFNLADQGLEFADALHLAATPPGATFMTFDRDLIRRATAQGLDAREP